MTSLVILQTFYDREEAIVVKSLLQAHGIPAVLPDWFTVSNAWHLTFALQGSRLCVMEKDLAQARDLVAERKSIEASSIEVSSGSIIPASLLWAIMAFLIAGVPHRIRRCK